MRTHRLQWVDALALGACLVVAACRDPGRGPGAEELAARAGGQVQPSATAAALRALGLGTLGGRASAAVDLNAAGQVIGDSNPPGSEELHAFLWEHGIMTDLGTLGGPESHAGD